MPFIRTSTTPGGTTEERLLILEHEPSGGRPVGPQYWDREGMKLRSCCHKKKYLHSFLEKLKFMDAHGIDVSVVRRVLKYIHSTFYY